MNKKSVVAAVGLIAIAVIVILALKKDTGPRLAAYCSSDGTLTDKMPIQSHRSYCLKSEAFGKKYATKKPAGYSFSIVDDRGDILKDFEVTHTKLLHMIVVRKDLRHFQHLHPEFDQATGRFTLPGLTFPAGGMYRVFADFAPAGGMKDPQGASLPVTVWADVAVGTGAAYVPEAIGSDDATKTFGKTQVTLTAGPGWLTSGSEVTLAFDLKENGKPVTDLQEYLGALGHTVILHEKTLDFIHAHPVEDASEPQNGKVTFAAFFSEAGKYKVFTQFQKDGKVFTTDFVIAVSGGESPPDAADTETQQMGH